MNLNSIKVTCIEKNNTTTISLVLVEEEPLFIRVDGNPYSVVMRTPGNEKEHAAGLCLSEGIIDRVDDIASIDLYKEEANTIVTITLTKLKRLKIPNLFKHKEYINNTSCATYGKEIINDLTNTLVPIKDNSIINKDKLLSNLLQIKKYQPLRKLNKATHCSVIYDKNSIFLSSAEDVGRHNALDKAIGSSLINKTISRAHILTLSSRISCELVQKAARARIPIISAISRPTSLAVELATTLNITLTTLSLKNGLIIYCNAHHIRI